MRTALDIVTDYRSRGYSDDRLRALAQTRDEPMRGQILDILASEEQVDSDTDNMPAAEPEVAEAVTVEVDDTMTEQDLLEPVDETQQTDALDDDIEWAAELAEVEAGLEEAENVDAWLENILEEAGVTPEVLEEIAAKADALQDALQANLDDEDLSEGLIVDDATSSSAMIAAAYRRVGVTEADVVEAVAEEVPLASIEVERITPEEYFVRMQSSMTDDAIDMMDMHDEDFRPVLRLLQVNDTPVEEEESNVILLEPEYAVEPAAADADEYDHDEVDPFFAVDDMRMDDEASAYIVFPTDIQDSYSTVVASRKMTGLGEDKLFLMPCVDFDEIARPDHTTAQAVRVEEVVHEDASLFDFDQIARPAPAAMAVGEAVVASVSLLDQWWFDLDTTGARPAEAPELPMLAQRESLSTEELANVNEEMSALRRKLEQVEEATTLKGIMLGERDKRIIELTESLRLQEAEVDILREERDEVRAHAIKMIEIEEALDTARGEIQDMTREYESLEREHNIVTTETVPNLQADKSDLVDMIQEHEADEEALRETIHASSKRASYSVIAAAAAAFMLVMMPVFSFVSTPAEVPIEQHPYVANLSNTLAEQKQVITAFKNERQLKESELQALSARLEDVELAREEERRLLQNQSTQLALDHHTKVLTLQEKLQSLQGELMALRGTGRTVRDAPRSLEFETADHLRGTEVAENHVAGVEEWQRRQRAEEEDLLAAPTEGAVATVTTQPTQKKATVRRGEGLSQVLWRELGTSNPNLVKYITKTNDLKVDRRGYPILHPGQEIILPDRVDTAMATDY